MLNALSVDKTVAETPPAPEPPAVAELKQAEAGQSDNGRHRRGWLHVRVTDLNTGKGKVTVNIPKRWMRFGLNLGKHFAPEVGSLKRIRR